MDPLYSNPGVGREALTASGRAGHAEWTGGTFYWHRDQLWACESGSGTLGVVDDDTLHEHYAVADVVVLPSRYESFGLVLVEAMKVKKLVTS